MKARRAKPAEPGFVELPVLSMDQLKDLPGAPVPEGLMLVDLPADAIFGQRPQSEGGNVFVDWEAMEMRAALVKAGGIFVPLSPLAANSLARLLATWKVAPARFLQAHLESDIRDSAEDEEVEKFAVRLGHKLEVLPGDVSEIWG